MGRVPGCPAAGDGVPGPDRGRSDHLENPGEVVSGAPSATSLDDEAFQQVSDSQTRRRSRLWVLAVMVPARGVRSTSTPSHIPNKQRGNQDGGSIQTAKMAHFLTVTNKRTTCWR